MSSHRRRFLKASGAMVATLGGVVLFRAWDQGVWSAGQGPAYQPWTSWQGSAEEGALRLVRAAILASNPHNTQPWRFRLTPSEIDLLADPARSIGAIDPDRREMYIGLGCALENLLIAAQRHGYRADVQLQPTASDPLHIARIRLGASPPQPAPLYDAIPHRHTNRGAYDRSRWVSAELLDSLSALGAPEPTVRVFWFADPVQKRRMGELIVQAAEAIVADAQQSHDSASWFRSSWHQVQELRDGITLDAQALPPLIGQVAKILPSVSPARADKMWLETTRDRHVATAAAFGILAARDARSTIQRVQAGRLWQRIHLLGTLQGLAFQPLNQMPERADREVSLGAAPRFGDALKELLGDSGWQAMMPFRIGYPTVAARPSPRRDVRAVLID